MKKIIIFSLFSLLLCCQKENLMDDSKGIWRPNPVALIDDNQIQLHWIYDWPYKYVEPDKFEIYISIGTSDNQSSKNSPSTYSTNIWMINLKTSESIQITDIANLHLKDAGRPNWIDNEKFLFHGVGQDNKSHIYESSIITKRIAQKIDSDWNDYCPSISPDNKILPLYQTGQEILKSGYIQLKTIL